MTAIIGVDPGFSGALCLYDPATGTLEVWDMPTFTLPKAGKGVRTELDLYGLAAIVDVWAKLKVRAFVEQVSATPQMGVTSAFSFGGAYWAARAVLAAHFIHVEPVAPLKWKRALLVPAAKDGARARASALLPAHAMKWPLKKHDGRAEAALIALYGARQLARAAA